MDTQTNEGNAVVCDLSAEQTLQGLRRDGMPPWRTVSEIKTFNLRLRFGVNQKVCPHLPQLHLQGQHEK